MTRHERRAGSDLPMRHLPFYLLVAVAVLSVSGVAGQGPPAGRQGGPPAGPPPTARASAPIDLTGQWVSIVTEDWRWRMVTPPKGDYASVPLNAEGRKAADGWDLAADNASGNQCRAFGAAAIHACSHSRSHLVAGRQHVEARNRRRPADTSVPVRIAHTFRRVTAASGTRRCEKLAGSLHRSVVQAAADTRVGLRRQRRAARRKP